MRHAFRVPLVLAALFTLLCPAPARAADGTSTPASSDGGIVGIDVMTASVFQEGQSSFSGIAARLRMRSAALVRSVEILPGVEYWQNSSKVNSLNLKTRRRDATLACDARWVFAHERWQPYAGVGVGLHFLSEQATSSPLQLNSEHSTVRDAFAMSGGVQFAMGEKLGSFLELKFHNAAGYRQIKFNTGLSWNY